MRKTFSLYPALIVCYALGCVYMSQNDIMMPSYANRQRFVFPMLWVLDAGFEYVRNEHLILRKISPVGQGHFPNAQSRSTHEDIVYFFVLNPIMG